MSLDWFPRVLGSRCGRYTVVANRTSDGWNYLPFYIDGRGIAKPLCAAVDSVEKAQGECGRHSQRPKAQQARTESDAVERHAGSAAAV